MVLLWLVSTRDILKKLRHILCTRKFELYAWINDIKVYQKLLDTDAFLYRRRREFSENHVRLGSNIDVVL